MSCSLRASPVQPGAAVFALDPTDELSASPRPRTVVSVIVIPAAVNGPHNTGGNGRDEQRPAQSIAFEKRPRVAVDDLQMAMAHSIAALSGVVDLAQGHLKAGIKLGRTDGYIVWDVYGRDTGVRCGRQSIPLTKEAPPQGRFPAYFKVDSYQELGARSDGCYKS